MFISYGSVRSACKARPTHERVENAGLAHVGPPRKCKLFCEVEECRSNKNKKEIDYKIVLKMTRARRGGGCFS